jgi:hypothetical protein
VLREEKKKGEGVEIKTTPSERDFSLCYWSESLGEQRVSADYDSSKNYYGEQCRD